MNKLLTIAVREFLATVRTRAFIFSVVLMPVLIVGSIYGGQWVEQAARHEQQPTRRLVVVDRAGGVLENLRWQVEAHNQERPNQQFELEEVPAADQDEDALTQALSARVRQEDLYGYVIITPDAVSGAGGCVLARKDNQLQLGQRIERWLSEAVIAARLREARLDPLQIHALRRQDIPIRELDAKTGAPVTENSMARMLTPFAFMFLLFMGTFGISQGLLTTLIEEKSSRVIEVLLSAVSPTQLLAGKILGMAAVGLLLLGVWGSVGMSSAQRYGVSELVTGYRLVIALLYFLPGFLLISALLAAVGSACNELREAQSMVFPLSLLTIIPMIFWFYIAEHPASLFSLVLSYIPPITPFVMILRICSDPDTPLWQVASTLALLWGSVVVMIWAAGKVFRVGVLMYGKPPTPAELLRWVRYS
jgi:ABC-type Na+ efflux pump permease subunit